MMETVDVCIYPLLDTLVPDLCLPTGLCQDIQDSFGLEYNSSINRYLVNDSALDRLLSSNIRLSFLLGGDLSTGNATINITLPYDSFNLIDQFSSLNKGSGSNGTRYFPLRQAENSTQYTIGRALFQNAYVIADYERLTFSVHQAILPNLATKSKIIPILPTSANTTNGEKVPPSHSHKLRSGTVVTIAVAAAVAIVIGAIIIIASRRRAVRRKEGQSDMQLSVYCKPELDENSQTPPAELATEDPSLSELHDRQWRGPELNAGDYPPVPELSSS